MIKHKNNILHKYSMPVVLAFIITLFCNAQQQTSGNLLKMMPEIPAEITEPIQRADYLVIHYWDKYDFNNTAPLLTDNLLERSFVEYIDLLSLVSGETMDRSIDLLMKKAAEKKEVFLFISKLSEQYLYNPDSPVYDEEKLIPFLQWEIKSTLLDDTEKIRPQFLLESIMKNRAGQPANDFTYTLTDGRTGTLHGINADYTLLYFNDPECEDCLMLTKKLIASPTINELIQQKKLKILTVYLNDDIEAWEKHASTVLNSWIYSRDTGQKINMESIYNIKQFPTLYLLDKDKKVLLKDTTFEKLGHYFNEQQ